MPAPLECCKTTHSLHESLPSGVSCAIRITRLLLRRLITNIVKLDDLSSNLRIADDGVSKNDEL